MSFSRILYMICVNGGYLVSDIFNNIDRKTWREIKETLQWPPMKINWWYVPGRSLYQCMAYAYGISIGIV